MYSCTSADGGAAEGAGLQASGRGRGSSAQDRGPGMVRTGRGGGQSGVQGRGFPRINGLASCFSVIHTNATQNYPRFRVSQPAPHTQGWEGHRRAPSPA